MQFFGRVMNRAARISEQTKTGQGGVACNAQETDLAWRQVLIDACPPVMAMAAVWCTEPAWDHAELVINQDELLRPKQPEASKGGKQKATCDGGVPAGGIVSVPVNGALLSPRLGATIASEEAKELHSAAEPKTCKAGADTAASMHR
jgi:hypothetical protein